MGEGGGIVYNGHSALYDPRGERLTHFCEEESLLIGEIEPEKVRKCRDIFPLKKDRREELYRRLGSKADQKSRSFAAGHCVDSSEATPVELSADFTV